MEAWALVVLLIAVAADRRQEDAKEDRWFGFGFVFETIRATCRMEALPVQPLEMSMASTVQNLVHLYP
jgi:hypothetical protein